MNHLIMHFFTKEAMQLSPEKAEQLKLLQERQRGGMNISNDFVDMLSSNPTSHSADLRKSHYSGYTDDELRYMQQQLDDAPGGYNTKQSKRALAKQKRTKMQEKLKAKKMKQMKSSSRMKEKLMQEKLKQKGMGRGFGGTNVRPTARRQQGLLEAGADMAGQGANMFGSALKRFF